MNDYQITGLALVEQLMKEHKFDNSLEQLEKILRNERLPRATLFQCKLLKSQILNQKGSHETALVTAENLYHSTKDHDVKIAIDAVIEMAGSLFRLGRLDECLEKVGLGEKLLDNQAINKLSKLEFYQRKSLLKNREGTVYHTKGDLKIALKLLFKSLSFAESSGDEKCVAAPLQNIGLVYSLKGDIKCALEHYQRSLFIYQRLNDQVLLAHTHYNIGTAYWKQGELTLALEHFQKSLFFYNKLGNIQGKASVFLNMSLVHRDNGNLDLALDESMKALEFYEKINNKYFIAKAYNAIATIYLKTGKLSKSLEYFRKRHFLTEELGNKTGIALSLNNIGAVYYSKGETNLALDYYLQALEIYLDLDVKQALARSYHNIGGIYKNKGNFKLAFDYYKKSLNLKEKLTNNLDMALTLFMINDLIAEHDPLRNPKYLQRLQTINEIDSNNVVNQLFLAARGIFLRNDPEKIKREEAREIFHRIITEKNIVDYELTLLARYYLSEMLFYDFVETGETELLKELEKRLKALTDFCDKNNFHGVKYAVLLLLSKLKLLESSFDISRSLLEEILAKARIMGNDGLVNLCLQELEEIEVLEMYKNVEIYDSHEDLLSFNAEQIEEVIKYLNLVKKQFDVLF